MLILTRKKNQSVTIGPNCVVKIVEIRGGKVSVGVEAPKDIPVWRTELIENALADQNKQAEAG